MKITICISGQTRSWGEYPSKNLGYFVSQLEQLGHTVDVVGHTWSYRNEPFQYPSQDIVQFKKLVVDDQVVIEDWVKQDWTKRIVIDNEMRRFFDYSMDDQEESTKKLEYNNLSTDQINDMLIYTRSQIGQHISGWKSFQLADNDSDIYLRWRWDLIFSTVNAHVDEEDYKNNIDYWIEYLNDLFTYATKIDTGFHFCGEQIHLESSSSVIVDDQYFIFTNKAKQKIDNIDIFNAIDTYARDNEYDCERGGYHFLWTYINIHMTREIGTSLFPNIARATYNDVRYLREIETIRPHFRK
jgi:hypothetical protein